MYKCVMELTFAGVFLLYCRQLKKRLSAVQLIIKLQESRGLASQYYIGMTEGGPGAAPLEPYSFSCREVLAVYVG